MPFDKHIFISYAHLSFADEIVFQFPKTEILVSVLSKCYVKAEWPVYSLAVLLRKYIETFEGSPALPGNSRPI